MRTSVRIGIALSFPVLLLPMIASAADVHPRVFQQAVAQGSSDVVFVFGDQAQPLLAPLSEMADYRTRRRALVDALRARADHDQRDLRVWLDRQGIAHRDFWIANVIQARVPASAVDPL
ncbi:MAG TPA: hypothetical protein VF132_06755, partial [Rudaea sp.]